MSAALSRVLLRSFSTVTATSNTSAVADSTIKSLSQDLYKERSLKRLVEKFKNASENEIFRKKTGIYKDTVRRLASAKNFRYIEEILEDQKNYVDINKEGFNARLISLYGFSGMFHNARKVFDEMLDRRCDRTVLSFNALLGACVSSKKFDEVEGLFRGLAKQLRIEPDVVSYNTVIKAFCESSSLDSGVLLLDEMEENGVMPNLITFNTLLHGFYANGRFADGERIWERMLKKNVQPDIRSYTSKLLGMGLEKRMKDAVKVFDEMKSQGIELDACSFSALIRGFVVQEDLEAAKHWYGQVGTSDCRPDRLTYEALIPFVTKKGDTEFAFELCKDVLRSKLLVKEALIQDVVDALAQESKIKAAKDLVNLGKTHRGYSYKLKLPSD